MPRPKVSDYDYVDRATTGGYMIMSDVPLIGHKPPIVLKITYRGGNPTRRYTIELLDGNWPDMKDFCDNHIGAIPQCGGHSFIEKTWSYGSKHLNVSVYGCN